jgi:hypothetical protein
MIEMPGKLSRKADQWTKCSYERRFRGDSSGKNSRSKPAGSKRDIPAANATMATMRQLDKDQVTG